MVSDREYTEGTDSAAHDSSTLGGSMFWAVHLTRRNGWVELYRQFGLLLWRVSAVARERITSV